MNSPALHETTLSRTPLYGWHVSQGARMVPFAGYEMPVQYPTGIMAEHHHTRLAAGLFDISHMGGIVVERTPENQNALKRIIPLEWETLNVGQMRYGLLLNEHGGIEDDLIAASFEGYWLIVVNAGCKHKDLTILQKYVSATLVEDVALLALQGPKAREVMGQVIPKAETLTFMNAIELGENSWLSCSGYTGEDGFEIIIPAAQAEDFAQKLCAFEQVKPIGLGARDSLRLEAGLCLYGHDMSTETTPVEASLLWAVAKAYREAVEFLGCDRIRTQIQTGPKHKRVGLIGQTSSIGREGATIHDDADQQIGHITSGCPSPSLGKPIAMGYVDAVHATPGQTVFVKIRGQNAPFAITPTPFIQQRYFRG